MPIGAETFAIAELAMVGWAERSPVRTRSPSALAKEESRLRSVEASEICRSSTSDLLSRRCWRDSNCAFARSSASATMSTPLPAPSVLAIEDARVLLVSFAG